jgi:hypothetical protein
MIHNAPFPVPQPLTHLHPSYSPPPTPHPHTPPALLFAPARLLTLLLLTISEWTLKSLVSLLSLVTCT